jgi:cholesterol oxidase
VLQPRRQFLARAALALPATVGAAGLLPGRTAEADVPTRGPAAFWDKTKTFDSSWKRRARLDYQQSFAQWGGQLSNSMDELFSEIRRPAEPTFDFLIVGSGYGGAILATRLSAQAHRPQRVAIFERGREWLPGTFPDRFADLTAQTRETTFGPGQKRVQNPLGLFDVRINDEVDVMVGSGLGGTSLINASIALRPTPDVFWQPEWPAALRDIAELEPYYDLAELTLGVTSRAACTTAKVAAQQFAAGHMGYRHEPTALSVILQQQGLDAASRNRHGVRQRACTYCGDCITGCNVGAKGTLTTSYLPLAKRQGVRMFTQTEVRYVEPCAVGWRVHFTYWHDDGQALHPVHDTVTTANLVLAAGSLGTTELLLRSSRQGVSLSPRLGCQWSTNGDGLGFIRRTKTMPQAVGVGAYVADFPPVGPTVETTTYVNEEGPLEERLLIQEGAIPRGVANFFGLLFQNPDLNNTLALLAVGHDNAGGTVRLVDNRATISWPNLQDSPHRRRIQQTIREFARVHGGKYCVIRAFGDRLATVHPLGGCGMGDSLQHGVVNHLGQVFAAQVNSQTQWDAEGQAVYRGLYVADGSVVPRSLGANPYMTICALSERIAFHLPNQAGMEAYLRPWS